MRIGVRAEGMLLVAAIWALIGVGVVTWTALAAVLYPAGP